jgi:hypothetical protein
MVERDHDFDGVVFRDILLLRHAAGGKKNPATQGQQSAFVFVSVKCIATQKKDGRSRRATVFNVEVAQKICGGRCRRVVGGGYYIDRSTRR